MIKLNGISKTYKVDKLESTVLSDINLSIEEGEYVSVCGPSGCGKSTLLSIMGLLSSASTGEYLLNGEDATRLKPKQLAGLRNRHMGFIFQAFNLSTEMTAEENIELPLSYRKDMSRQDRKRAVLGIMEKMSLTEFARYFPGQLSGGQQQRVAIARALAGKPKMVLADEPTGNLDSKNAAIVMEILRRMNAEGTTVCLVTHDPRSAAHAQRTIELLDGKIVSASHPGEATSAATGGFPRDHFALATTD